MDYTTLLAHRSFLTSGSDEFALMYSKLAGQIAKDEDVALYRSILEGNAPGMEDLSPEDHRDVRFGAFYVLCVYYRRQKEFTVLTRLVNSRAAAFSEEPLYKFQKAVAMKSGFPNAETLAKAITLFQEIMSEQEAADEMPFFAQAYADTVASYYDELNKDELSSEDLKVLADEPFVMYEKGRRMWKTSVDLCESAGFVPHVAFESNSCERLDAMVNRGMGIGFVPTAIDRITNHSDKVNYYPVDTDKAIRTLTIGYLDKNMSSAAREFIRVVMDSQEIY